MAYTPQEIVDDQRKFRAFLKETQEFLHDARNMTTEEFFQKYDEKGNKREER